MSPRFLIFRLKTVLQTSDYLKLFGLGAFLTASYTSIFQVSLMNIYTTVRLKRWATYILFSIILTMFFLFLTKMLVKNKKKRPNSFRQEGEKLRWNIFGYLLFHFCFWFIQAQKKIKKIEQTYQRVGKQLKGNKEMSRLLEELKGQTVSIRLNGF